MLQHYLRTVCILPITIIIAIFWNLSAKAETIDISREYKEAIGQHIQIDTNGSTLYDLHDALQVFRNGRFSSSGSSVINFGIGSEPKWLAFRVSNSENTAVHRNLMIENAWLDKIDVYFLQNNQLINHYHMGDSLVFRERPLDHRFFVAGHDFEYGETTVLIRVESPDPMALPIYFMSTADIIARNTLQTYSYGFLYGAILSLIAYNLLLYAGIRNSHHLLYSVYLLSFLMINVAYTGHGYQWLWPESRQWQLWSNPVLMMTCAISGLTFAIYFLNIKASFPRIHRTIIAICLSFCTSLILAIWADGHAAALLISFIFVFIFSSFMVALGIISLRAGNKFAKYFLLASISAVSGMAITAAAVWGLIPFNLMTYRAADIGMVMDAILLALALAERINISQQEKLLAEKIAGIDPLTNLNNRRSFHKFVKPIWATSLRNRNSISIIMLDIDNFKLLNDNHGHSLGDRVLVRLAETLQKEARTGDILARWGGEEFIVFLPETQLADAVTIADRLRRKISTIRLTTTDKKKLSFTSSFGVAHTIDSNISLDELISRADQQLYRAKKQGRNCVCSDQSGQQGNLEQTIAYDKVQ